MKAFLDSLFACCMVASICSCSPKYGAAPERTGSTPQALWYGSRPVHPTKPHTLDGFQPGSTHKDPYTGQIHTANQDGQLVVP